MSSEEEEAAQPARRHTAKELYALYGASLIPVISVNADGDQGVGSAFHVGDGAFVTARHVIEGMASCHIELDGYRLMRLAEGAARSLGYEDHGPTPINPLPHPDPKKDVAVFSVPCLAELPAVPLGSHLDDWITDHDFVLNEVLVLGFPPIPLSKKKWSLRDARADQCRGRPDQCRPRALHRLGDGAWRVQRRCRPVRMGHRTRHRHIQLAQE